MGSPSECEGAVPVPPALAARFDTVIEEVRVGDFSWSLLAVRDSNRLVDAMTVEAFAADERLPYWADLWTSAIALAAHLRERPGVSGRAVLELGCGLGLCGIAAAQAGGVVTMTDCERDALAFARHNAERNLSPEDLRRLAIRQLDWRKASRVGRFDLIIGADIIYERRDFTPVLALLRSALHPGGVALLTDPDRSIGNDFLELASLEGYTLSRRQIPVGHRGRTVTVVLAELSLPRR